MNDDYYGVDKFASLKGETLWDIGGMRPGSVEVTFKTASGKQYFMYHDQDCCESVRLEDVAGLVDDLINTEILEAYTSSNYDNLPAESYESFTWTFYTLRTIKGTVVLRWLGESNGYYSEAVTFSEKKSRWS